MNADISIIIPMYNTGNFVSECVNSIKSKYLNIEIIIIDDGSEDNSFQIVNSIVQNDKRIILKKTENNGLGEARNYGLDISHGKYIMFVDSDDWVIDNALDTLYKEAVKNDLDMLMGNALFYYSKEDVRKRYKIHSSLLDRVYNGKECYVKLLNTNSFIPMVYSYIYKRSFLQHSNVRFQKGIYEDELWTLQTVCLAKSIKVIDYSFYYYRQRMGSIMNGGGAPDKKINSLIALTKNIITFSHNYSFAEDNELKGWLYVKAIQMFYYAIIKFDYGKDQITFFRNNLYILKGLIGKKDQIHNNTVQYFLKYYIHSIYMAIYKQKT